MNYKGKKVLIFGLGLNEGGVGSAKFFASKGAEVLVTDLKSEQELQPSLDLLKDFPEIEYHLGGHSNDDIDWADLIVKNQAVKPGTNFLLYALSQGKEIQTDVGIFLQYVKPENIIGVTGTKGKSTTSSLIYEILKQSGKKVILSGNIGKSVLDSIDNITEDTITVLEISSFQLESFEEHQVSPKYAVITNIYPDHLNYYTSMDDYISSKKLIAKYQTEKDYLFINKEDPLLNSEDFLNGVKSRIMFFSSGNLPSDLKRELPGEHNLSNIAAAFAVSKVLNINEEDVLKAVSAFKGIKFRLELIKESGGIKIYNNTTATAPEPAIESLKTFPQSILICGGMNKGLRFKEFGRAIDQYAKEVYFLKGDATEEIKKEISSQEKIKGTFDNLEKLLLEVKKSAGEGDTILFSPGATSFNLFHNEFDRGRKFNEAVEKIFS